MDEIQVEKKLRETRRQANFALFRKRNEYWKQIKDEVKVKVSKSNQEKLEQQDRRYFHRNDTSPRGFKFLKKKKDNTQDEEEPVEDQESVLNKSSYEKGKEYLRAFQSTQDQKEKYKKSLVIQPPPRKVYADFLQDFKQKSKELTDEERMEIRIRKCLDDPHMTAAEKKDKVRLITSDYENRKDREASKKRLVDNSEK